MKLDKSITKQIVEKKLDEIRRREESADIIYRFLPRPYIPIEDYVAYANVLLDRIILDCQAYFNDFSKKSLFIFYCNELMVKVIKPSYQVHRILNHTLLYNYTNEIEELTEKIKQTITILMPEDSIDNDFICVEDNERGDHYYNRIELMELAFSDRMKDDFEEERFVDMPLTDSIKKYDKLYQEWEHKTTEIILEQYKRLEKQHPNADEGLKCKTLATLLGKYKDFYDPINDNRNITWNEVLNEFQNEKACHIEAGQNKILQNCFENLSRIDSVSIQLTLLGVLKMAYSSLIILNNNHRQYRVRHELHEPIVKVEREWHKALISTEFVEEIESYIRLVKIV